MLLLCLNLLALSASAEIRHLYLTWGPDPCTSIVINIHGIETPDDLTLYYDTHSHLGKFEEYSQRATAKGSTAYMLPDERKLYHLLLSDLLPDTSYFFTVDGVEKRFRTLPKKGPLCFVEGGDWENAKKGEVLAIEAAKKNPHALWLGGDYPSHVFGWRDYKKWDEWLDIYTKTMISKEGNLIPLVAAIGNHEVIRQRAPFYFHYFHQGDQDKSYFSMPLGNFARLFVLDSGHLASHDGEQKKWLQKELERSTEKIKIALYHVPLYPSVRTGKKEIFYYALQGILKRFSPKISEKLFSELSPEGMMHWLPLFDHHGLTCAFEHHDQALKRTKLLFEGKEDPDGTLYLGAGCFASGVQVFPVQGFFQNHFAFLKGKVQFFWFVEMEEGQITYQAINAEGVAIDHFVQKLGDREDIRQKA